MELLTATVTISRKEWVSIEKSLWHRMLVYRRKIKSCSGNPTCEFCVNILGVESGQGCNVVEDGFFRACDDLIAISKATGDLK